MNNTYNKIGLLTFYDNNYGSALQCYATKHVIQENGYDCIVLDEEPSREQNIIIKGVRFYYRCILDPHYFQNRRKNLRAMTIEYGLISKESEDKISLFVKRHLSPKKCSYDALTDIGNSDSYSCFIAGSDQILNSSRPIENRYLLNFTKPEKRIAFAVSFGVSEVSRIDILPLKKGLKQFRSLSVREESGQKIVKDLIGRDVPRLCDPVVLLTADEWKEKSKEGVHLDSPYIFIHFLNEPNDTAIKAITYLSEKENVNPICFAYHHDKLKHIDGIQMIDGDPFDYVNLIANADYICTDSFHTTMFSIIFKKQFFTFQRQYLHNNPQTSRITDLLKRYGLEERFITNADTIENAEAFKEYNCDEKLDQERNKAMKFLKKAIDSAG